MMKRNKFLALGLALVMALTLAACGNDAADSTPSPSATAGEENNTGSKTYQFTGKYEEDSANASMLNAAFLLNLNEDGTAVADRYMFDNYDDSDAATNPTYTASYMSGTWKEAERDGVACLQIKLAYVDEAGNESNGQTAYAYDVAGVYSFDMTFPVVPGMSYTRTATMEGTEGKTYEDANAFIQAFKAEFVAPENVAALTDEANGGTAYLQPDGTLLIYAGYNNVAQGTWNVENGAPGVFCTYDTTHLVEEIKKAKQQCDYVFVAVHWGVEHTDELTDYQPVIAHQLIDAGADGVIGSHPHVLQGMEFYQGKPIFYSLGNFIFNREIGRTAAVEITVTPENEMRIRLVPASAENAYTHSVAGEEAQAIFRYMDDLSGTATVDENGMVTPAL